MCRSSDRARGDTLRSRHRAVGSTSLNLASLSSSSRISLSCDGGEDLAVGEILKLHLLRAERDEDAIELRVVIHVFLALLALDEVERRAGDVNLALLHELRHLPVKERQQQRADVGAVHVGIGHDDDAAVAQFGDIECAFLVAARRCRCPPR